MDAGELVIKTILETKDVKGELKDLERELKQEEKSLKEFLKYKIELETDADSYDEVLDTLEKIQELQNQGKTEIEIDGQIYQLENLKEEQEYIKGLWEKINEEIQGSTNSVNELKQAINIKKKILDAQNGMESFGKQIGKSIKSITKMGLALLGIRGIYGAIRSAISTLSRGNEDIANTLNYARTMLATALEPIVIRIVDWLKQIMALINYISKRWFGRDLFAETNKNLKQANKSAGALKKTLAGFDEMNILNSSSSGGGGGIPDLPKVDDNSIFKWILDNKNTVLNIIAAITTGLISMRLLGINPLQALLLGITTYGVIEFLQGIVEMFNDPTWLAFGKTIEGLGIAFVGLGLTLQTFAATSGPVGWVIAGIGALLTIFGSYVQKLEETAASVHDVNRAEQELADARGTRQNSEKKYADAIKNEEKALKDLQKAEKDTKLSGEEVYKMVENGTKKYQELTEPQRKVYDAYLNEQIALTNIDNALKDVNDKKQIELKGKYDTLIANDKEGQSYQKLKEEIVNAVNEEKLSVEQAQDLISKMLSDVNVESENVFLKDIPNNIKKGLDVSKYDNFGKKFGRGLRDAIITGFGTLVLGGAGGLGLSATWSLIKGAKGLMMYDKAPKLAVGGIVNAPGRGIPYRGATIAEHGAEAIVPLTDSQQLELLGATIGRYITVMNTNPIYMNGRLIAKEINKSNAEDDFAFNR